MEINEFIYQIKHVTGIDITHKRCNGNINAIIKTNKDPIIRLICFMHNEKRFKINDNIKSYDW